ncbi:polysaccharide biosynthesis protein [Polaribacter sp. IC066]|uniref:polysaccharide pyruvyl transferase family protein n=1 Tax=Polaribacter sp. IC066 TaxID=57032 RepID=UPI0011BDDF69|nr:polysaccharide pyruvyl transferase family protein [Polaribacter sp. IC066]TXD56692.1 polysaccharide biosynthesis protein [Polaribacter sp. IC066]
MLSKFINFRTKYSILLFIQKFKAFKYFKNVSLDKNKKYAFIFLAADYGNLGDVAITYAQTKFLEKNANFQVVEIPISKSLEGLWFVKRNIQEGDIVTTVGGGNLGDLYDQIEYIRQLVVKFFPNNKIISFPQTFDFSETNEGAIALSRAKRVYNKHKQLVFIAREKISYELMRKHFTQAKVLLTPDIVLTLDKTTPERNRKGVIFTLRQDKEKNLTEEQYQFILESVKANFKNISYLDTHINKNNLSIFERVNELNSIWESYRSAELVITDRLHGMIFCYITNTPCIVFLNNNHKVKGTYKWIKGNINIKLQAKFSKQKFKEDLEGNRKVSPYFNINERFDALIKEL